MVNVLANASSRALLATVRVRPERAFHAANSRNATGTQHGSLHNAAVFGATHRPGTRGAHGRSEAMRVYTRAPYNNNNFAAPTEATPFLTGVEYPPTALLGSRGNANVVATPLESSYAIHVPQVYPESNIHAAYVQHAPRLFAERHAERNRTARRKGRSRSRSQERMP